MATFNIERLLGRQVPAQLQRLSASDQASRPQHLSFALFIHHGKHNLLRYDTQEGYLYGQKLPYAPRYNTLRTLQLLFPSRLPLRTPERKATPSKCCIFQLEASAISSLANCLKNSGCAACKYFATSRG